MPLGCFDLVDQDLGNGGDEASMTLSMPQSMHSSRQASWEQRPGATSVEGLKTLLHTEVRSHQVRVSAAGLGVSSMASGFAAVLLVFSLEKGVAWTCAQLTPGCCVSVMVSSQGQGSPSSPEITSRKRERLAVKQGWAGFPCHFRFYHKHLGLHSLFATDRPGRTIVLILISSQEQRTLLFLAFFNCVVITHLQNK